MRRRQSCLAQALVVEEKERQRQSCNNEGNHRHAYPIRCTIDRKNCFIRRGGRPCVSPDRIEFQAAAEKLLRLLTIRHNDFRIPGNALNCPEMPETIPAF